MLRGQPVRADQRHLLELGAGGAVDHDAVLAPFERAGLHAGGTEIGHLVEEVRLEDHPVELDPEPGQRLAVAGQHPGAGLRPQLEHVRVAGQDAVDDRVGAVVVHDRLAVQRVLDGLVPGLGPRLDVGGVARADEVVALAGDLVQHLRVLAGVHEAGHRLAHPAADVRQQAAPLDGRAGLGQGGAQRVTDRQVAQVPDVERLGGVGAPEVDGGPLARRQILVAPGAGLGPDPLTRVAQPRVVEPHVHDLAVRNDGVYDGTVVDRGQ